MQTRGMTRAALVSTLVFVCLACRTVNESRLIGTYRGDGSCVTITLAVKPDHSFVQQVQTRKGETNELAGRWKLDKEDRSMTFEPFLDFLNDTRGRQVEFSTFTPETMGWMIKMGPLIVKCPDSNHQIDFVK
jgi:hypothetical protein